MPSWSELQHPQRPLNSPSEGGGAGSCREKPLSGPTTKNQGPGPPLPPYPLTFEGPQTPEASHRLFTRPPKCVSVSLPDTGPGHCRLQLPANYLRGAPAAGWACVWQVRWRGGICGSLNPQWPGPPLRGHRLGPSARTGPQKVTAIPRKGKLSHRRALASLQEPWWLPKARP